MLEELQTLAKANIVAPNLPSQMWFDTLAESLRREARCGKMSYTRLVFSYETQRGEPNIVNWWAKSENMVQRDRYIAVNTHVDKIIHKWRETSNVPVGIIFTQESVSLKFDWN